MLNLVNKDLHSFQSSLDEIARQGALKVLCHALSLEVDEYIAEHAQERDENGHRLVVRNGRSKPRTVSLGAGTIEIEAPRVNDKRPGEKFTSSILPPYLLRSPNIESLIPVLYLRGLSTNDFQEALVSILGEGAKGLSPSVIVSLKRSWESEFEQWMRQPITEPIVYLWADGVNVKVRLGEDKRLCLLVVIGATESGQKRLLAVSPGYRESTDSWKIVLRSLIDRGMTSPLLAIADGALGFWAALEELEAFKTTKPARCWVHKIANVLNDLPKRLQAQAKGLLHEMMYSSTKSDAEIVRKQFADGFSAKFPKAVEKVQTDWKELTAFFDFPAEHWHHLRTTNPIESAFATVKLRTKITKGAGSTATASAMAFKLLQQAEKRWRKIKSVEKIRDLLNGVEYRDGIVLDTSSHRGGVA